MELEKKNQLVISGLIFIISPVGGMMIIEECIILIINGMNVVS